MHTMIPCPRFTALAVVALTLMFTLPVAAQGTPGVDPNKCLAGKNKCVSKLAASLLKCRELCQKTPDNRCGQAQIDCEQKARERFDGGAKRRRTALKALARRAERRRCGVILPPPPKTRVPPIFVGEGSNLR